MGHTLNLTDEEANFLALELPGVYEDLREQGEPERAEIADAIFHKVHYSPNGGKDVD